MSDANPGATVQAEMPSSWAMIRTLGGIATISGVLLALVFQSTRPFIQRNKQEALRQAVFTVIPGAIEQVQFDITDNGQLQRATDESGGDPELFTGWSKDERNRVED